MQSTVLAHLISTGKTFWLEIKSRYFVILLGGYNLNEGEGGHEGLHA